MSSLLTFSIIGIYLNLYKRKRKAVKTLNNAL
nr:MAG TPA: hypothetical protein [Caudoviricetes sp.]